VDTETAISADEEEDYNSGIITQESGKFANELHVIFGSLRYASCPDCTVSKNDLKDDLPSIPKPLS
jgi:hypothetical protein